MIDVAEIHVTDVEAFAQCRQKWYWQSPLRCGLQRAAMPEPLFLGQGVHVGLDYYYKNDQDVTAALSGFKQWVKKRAQAIEDFTGPLWEGEREMIRGAYELGTAMLLHYSLWAKRLDRRFEIVETEQKFKQPIPRPGLRGFDSTFIYLAGRWDGIVRDIETGDMYILEFKTTRSLSNMGWALRSLQCPTYVWAAQRQYGPQLKGIAYRFLRKKTPKSPKAFEEDDKIILDCKPSMTTFCWYKFCVAKYATDNELDVQQLYRDNINMLSTLDRGENKFNRQVIITKNKAQLWHAANTLYRMGIQMRDKRTPIFPMTGPACNWCSFRDVCDLMTRGFNHQDLLDVEYAKRDYWEGDKQ